MFWEEENSDLGVERAMKNPDSESSGCISEYALVPTFHKQ